MSAERVPPYSAEAERAVLGAVLLNNESMPLAARIITEPGAFYVEANKVIWWAMCRLHNAGHPVDHVTLGNALKDRGYLDRIGGAMVLADLTDSVATVANVESYARIVAAAHRQRSLIFAAQQVVARGYSCDPDPEAVDAYLGESHAAVSKAATAADLGERQYRWDAKDLTAQVWGGIEAVQNGDTSGRVQVLPTGIANVELMRGNLVIVGARTGVGKTAFTMNVARNLSHATNDWALIFSLEDHAARYGARLMARECGVPARMLQRGRAPADRLDDVLRAMDKVNDLPIHVIDRKGVSPSWIGREIDAFTRDRGRLSCIVIDYAQLVEPEPEDRRGDKWQFNALARTVRSSVQWAERYDVPVILVSQINRPDKSKALGPPKRHELRMSGELENAAKYILLLHNPEAERALGEDGRDEDTKQVVDLRVETNKQADGPRQVRWCRFDQALMDIEDKDAYSPPPEDISDETAF